MRDTDANPIISDGEQGKEKNIIQFTSKFFAVLWFYICSYFSHQGGVDTVEQAQAEKKNIEK